MLLNITENNLLVNCVLNTGKIDQKNHSICEVLTQK